MQILSKEFFTGGLWRGNRKPRRTLAQIMEDFWAKADRSGSGCWPWRAAMRGGYGVYSFGKLEQAHRLSWFFTWGPLPERARVCHSCDNPPCVNPAHLFLGTQADNMEDMKRKGRSRKPVP